MQPMQPPPGKAGLFAMRSTRQELHNVAILGPIPHAVNRQQIATTRAGLFRTHSRRRRWRDSQPVNATQPSTTRRKHAATGTCSPVPAAPGGLCIFAQNRAVQALQNRPISTTRNALQELYAAISNGLAAFQSTPGSAAQGIPDRPPGVDTLRICAVGVEFS